MTEDGMVGWHHRLNGPGFEQAPGEGEGQGGLACCSPWGRRESGTTERLNININRESGKAGTQTWSRPHVSKSRSPAGTARGWAPNSAPVQLQPLARYDLTRPSSLI